MSGTYYFAIIAHHDNPIYELEMTPSNKASEAKVFYVIAQNLNLGFITDILRCLPGSYTLFRRTTTDT